MLDRGNHQDNSRCAATDDLAPCRPPKRKDFQAPHSSWQRLAKPTPEGEDPQYEHHYAPRNEPPSGEGWLGPFCFGDHNNDPPSSPGPSYRNNGCDFLTTDTPSQPTFVGSTWNWTWLSIGMIVDRCHNNAVKKLKYLQWSIDGETTSNGVEIQKVTTNGE